MGIDALIEAARFVEYQAMLASLPVPAPGFMGASDRVNGNGAGPAFVQTGEVGSKSDVAHHPTSPKLTIPKDSQSSESHQQTNQISKKMVRNKQQLQRHCQQVKTQRAYLKLCLNSLKKLLPNMNEDCDVNGISCGKRKSNSTSSVLKKAKKEIRDLEGMEKKHLNEIETLKKEADALKEKLQALDISVIQENECDKNCA